MFFGLLVIPLMSRDPLGLDATVPSVCLTGSCSLVSNPWVVSVGSFFFSTSSSLTGLLFLFLVAFQEDSERYSRHSRRHTSVCITSYLHFLFFLFPDS